MLNKNKSEIIIFGLHKCIPISQYPRSWSSNVKHRRNQPSLIIKECLKIKSFFFWPDLEKAIHTFISS